MDRFEGVESSSRNTIKTDLQLLLECLKFQMKCPDLQKQALLTVLSICENREHNVELLREMGGVAFLVNLSKSSIVQSDVKETALFTLATLAEANVYCKNSLCRKEVFTDLADWLVQEEATVTKKRVIVYFLSVLVANNKLGQTLAQNTSCLDILLNLFRATFPLSAEGIFKTANSTQLLLLWSSVSSALCGCVNNPHNAEGQRVCVAVFPTVKNWIQQISLPQTEIFQPLCSFISMTVANNSCVQESFAASGGLEKLTLALIQFCVASETSVLSCQLAMSISKTLSACISDNRVIASVLAKYELICHLFSLLINPRLESEDRLSVLLTMGHCTEASEEHQRQLVQIGSLPVIITLLTEDASEEVRKAAAFILQTCKQATNTLGILEVKETTGKDQLIKPSPNTEAYKKSAKQLRERIDQLEKKQAEAEQELRFPKSSPQEETCLPVATVTPVEDGVSEEEPLIRRLNRSLSSTKVKRSCQEEASDAGSENLRWPPFNRAGLSLQSVSFVQPQEGAREPQDNRSHNHSEKNPDPQWQEAPKDSCSFEENLNNEVTDAGEEGSVSDVRCTGCVLRLGEVHSRTFASLQASCAHSCDMHKVLWEATKRYMSQHRRLFTPSGRTAPPAEAQKNQTDWRGARLTPVNKAGQVKRLLTAQQKEKCEGVRLTPLHKGMRTEGPAFCQRTAQCLSSSLSSALVSSSSKRSRPPEQDAEKNKANPPDDRKDNGQMEAETTSSSHRRRRQDFSREEELYLLCGVKTYGPSWNAILWSYPFRPGRTNVDLAKKYRRLMKIKAQDADLA